MAFPPAKRRRAHPPSVISSTTIHVAPENFVVDPIGDVILRMQKFSKAFTIKASSKVLTITSEFFSTLFSPKFAEGQKTPSMTSPPTYSLPGDDPDAMLMLCQIIHQSPKAADKVQGITLINLAVIGDKYGCAKSLATWFRGRLLPLFSDPQIIVTETSCQQYGVSLGDVVGISCIINDAMLFHRATKSMMPSASKTFADTEISTSMRLCLPEGLIDLVEKRRNKALKKLGTGAEAILQQIMRSSHRGTPLSKDILIKVGPDDARAVCSCVQTRVGPFLAFMEYAGAWPVSSSYKRPDSLLAVLDRLRYAAKNKSDAMPSPRKSLTWQKCTACQVDIGKELLSIIAEAEKDMTGLCLECVKAGKLEVEKTYKMCEEHPYD